MPQHITETECALFELYISLFTLRSVKPKAVHRSNSRQPIKGRAKTRRAHSMYAWRVAGRHDVMWHRARLARCAQASLVQLLLRVESFRSWYLMGGGNHRSLEESITTLSVCSPLQIIRKPSHAEFSGRFRHGRDQARSRGGRLQLRCSRRC